MNAIKIGLACFSFLALAACGSAQYTVESPDPLTGKPKILQTVEADAPGGDSFVTVVYYGANIAPTVSAGGDSSALVNATAAAAQDGLQLVLKAAVAK